MRTIYSLTFVSMLMHPNTRVHDQAHPNSTGTSNDVGPLGRRVHAATSQVMLRNSPGKVAK